MEDIHNLILSYLNRYSGNSYSSVARKIIKENPDVQFKHRTLRRKVATVAKQAQIEKTLPWILILDIETAPVLGYVWSLWKTNIYPEQVKDGWFCLTWSAKWLGKQEILSDKLTSEEAIRQDDKRLIEGIWHLVNKADIVIAHNGDRFDIPALNTRFLINGIRPPLPYRTIDTKKIAKNTFRFSSNSMDYLNRELGLQRKIDTDGMKLWIACLRGDEKALATMESYNRGDIIALEQLYLKLRSWMKSHPNLGVYLGDEETVCPVCGSPDVLFDGQYMTDVSEFDTYQCNVCGGIGRLRKSNLSKDKRKSLGISIAR